MGGIPWIARAWLPYLLIGILWTILGAVMLSDPQGVGLLFIGLVCLGFGSSGALWRIHRSYGLLRNLPGTTSTCR